MEIFLRVDGTLCQCEKRYICQMAYIHPAAATMVVEHDCLPTVEIVCARRVSGLSAI